MVGEAQEVLRKRRGRIVGCHPKAQGIGVVEKLRRSINTFLALGLLALGGGAMAWMVQTKPTPTVRTTFSSVLEVAVQTVHAEAQNAPIIGHGTVRPKNQINIVPQVSGKLVYAHPELAQGKVIPKGEVLFEIDPTVYESRVRQSEAEIRGLEATLERQKIDAVNLDERIANAEKLAAIDLRDYETGQRLYEVEKVGTQRDVDLVLQKYLRTNDALVELKSRRASMPAIQVETQAQLDASKARQVLARHDLESTKIRSPFEARVETIAAHEAQVVTAHFSIATLTDMEALEISVGIDPRELRWLDEMVRPAGLEREDRDALAAPAVTVRWSLPDQEFTWTGHVTRFERVDELSRTARMVVEIRDVNMTAKVRSGSFDSVPTLSVGMYCRAELPANPLSEALLVPRHAIHDDRWVYVFEPDAQPSSKETGRLGRREISMLRTIGDRVLVDYRDREGTEVCKLRAGEQVVVSQLTKPVVGMKIAMRPAEPAVAMANPAVPAHRSRIQLAASRADSTP